MTRKERQAANGIGSQKNALNTNRSEREKRYIPIKGKKESMEQVSVTKKLGLGKLQTISSIVEMFCKK